MEVGGWVSRRQAMIIDAIIRGVEPMAMEPIKTDPMLQFFDWGHLPPHLAEVSSSFAALAHHIVEKLPRNPERTVALRKLLEAKDCAVRAVLWKDG